MPNVRHNQLTNQQVRSAPAGVHRDGQGLELRVKDTGSRNWVLRITLDGKRRNFGLGGYPAVSLKEARAQAAMLRQRIRNGEAPRPQRKPVAETAIPTVPTFEAVAADVIEFRSGSWTNKRHATQWSESLRLHAYPRLGDRPIDSISTADVLAVLEPIWSAKAETATRVKQRMTVIFDYAIAKGWRPDNPCNGALKAALPPRTRERRHHPALPFDQVSDALVAVRNASARPSTKLAFEFLVLTAARPREVREATWNEIDWESRTWTRPAAHMKMRREHRVPLSDAAMSVLAQARKRSGAKGFIFPSKHRGAVVPLSNMAFEMLLRRAGYGHITVHGFRASFRTWTLEQTDTPWAVAEAALSHNLGGSEVMAYTRSDLFERRRTLMADWGEYVTL